MAPDDGLYAYLFETGRMVDDDKGPFAYLFERDVRNLGEDDRGPYAYLFDRDDTPRG